MIRTFYTFDSMKKLGLVGKNIDYSYSPSIFRQYFEDEGVEASYSYDLFDCEDVGEVESFLKRRDFHGCNVTIPYKELAARCCDRLIGVASEIGVVNTIVKVGDKLVGCNTDVFGIIAAWRTQVSIEQKKRVLIFGSGGAAKAVIAACNGVGFDYVVISRGGPSAVEQCDGVTMISYDQLASHYHLEDFDILVNCTPLGSVHHLDEMVRIQVSQISSRHFVHDLIYNPDKTLLLKRSQAAGAQIQNGMTMLRAQARIAWEIWKL